MIEVDFSLGGELVVSVLERLYATRGLPRTLVLDNGPEFTRQALDTCAHRRGAHLQFIRPGKPSVNPSSKASPGDSGMNA